VACWCYRSAGRVSVVSVLVRTHDRHYAVRFRRVGRIVRARVERVRVVIVDLEKELGVRDVDQAKVMLRAVGRKLVEMQHRSHDAKHNAEWQRADALSDDSVTGAARPKRVIESGDRLSPGFRVGGHLTVSSGWSVGRVLRLAANLLAGRDVGRVTGAGF
jgi:hypothetical protein